MGKIIENKNKKKKLWLLLLLVVIVCSVALYLNGSKDKVDTKEEILIDKEEFMEEPEDKNIDEKLEILHLGENPFESNEGYEYKKITLKELIEEYKDEIVIVNKEVMTEENKNMFIQLMELKPTVLFFGDEITAEEVVGYLNGIVPVVPLDASIPLKYQGYGVTELNNTLIPIFTSATFEQAELNSEAFEKLFSQINDKKQ